jgi:hypothetical protein
LLQRPAERPGVSRAELRQVVLDLERVVHQLVVRREGLRTERRVRSAVCCEDVHEWKQLNRGAILVVGGIAGDETLGDGAADHRVPFADAGFDVLELRVVRARETQEAGAEGAPAESSRRRARQVFCAAGIQLTVPEIDLVAAVEVVVTPEKVSLRGRHVGDILVSARVVLEILFQV